MNKKFLIMVCIMLAVLTIGSVSASDDISDDNNLTANTGDDAISSSVEEIELEADDTNDVVGDELISDYDYELNVKDTYLEGDYIQVWGNLPDDAEGYVSVDLDDERIVTNDVYGGYVNVGLSEFTTISKGTHFLKLNYTGDGKYQGFVWNKTFTVTDIKVDFPDEIQIGDEYDCGGRYLIRTVSYIDGNISILIDGEEYKSGSFEDLISEDNWDLVSYHVPVSIDYLSYGPHTYNVTYWIDGEKTTRTGVFNVSYFFKVYSEYFSEDMAYGSVGCLDVYLPYDVNGTLRVTINGKQKEYPAQKNNEIPLENLSMGINNITVTYSDANYPLKSGDYKINVIGQIVCLNSYIVFNEGGKISLILPEDATGQLCIYKTDDELPDELIGNVTLSNGKAEYVIDFGLGDTYVLAKYENGNYDVKDEEFGVTVIPDIVCPKSATIGSDVNLTIQVPDGTTENITVKVFDSNSYGEYDEWSTFAEIYDGPAKNLNLTLNTTNEGYYVVKVNCGSYSNDYLFHVFNATPEWELIVDFPKEVLSTDEYVCPTVNYPNGAVGTFTIYIDGENAGSSIVSPYDGLDDFEGRIINNTLGIHTWRVEYTDDPVFNDASQNGTFNITWAIFPEVVVLGDDSNIVQVGISNYDGEVTLKINGEVYREADTENGQVEIYLDNDFVPGSDNTYEITLGDLIKSGSFYVDYTFDVKVDDSDDFDYVVLRESNDLNIKMPDGATGTVSVTIGNSTYSGDIDENGMANIPINLKWGKNSVIITYNGNDAFPSKTVIVNFTVAECEILPQKEDGKLKSVSVLVPEFATGNLTVLADWNEFKTVKVENGYATLSLDDLPIGTYTLVARYDEGEEEYFYVAQYEQYCSVEPDMNITEKITEGEDCIIEIALPNSTSTIDLYIDGELNETYTFDEGKLKMTISNLALGTHTITFNYNGYDYPSLFQYYDEDIYEYLPIPYNVEVCEKTELADPDFSIVIANVVEGTPITVEVTANVNFTGEVVVKIGDNNVTVLVEDGNGVNVTDIVLAVGDDYVATLAFEGNDAFNAGSAQTTFNVTAKTKVDPDFAISIANVVEGTPITVEVTANVNFTGEVVVKIGDNNVTVLVEDGNGVNVTDIVLAVGDDYVATLAFEGNDAFNAGSAQTTFNVTEKTKYDANLNVSAADVFVGQNVLVVVSVNETATGNVTININGTDEIIQIINGKGNYTISDLSGGKYNYTITYSGDEYFLSDSKIVSFNVRQDNARIEIINDVNEYNSGNFTFKVLSNIDDSALNNVTVMLRIIKGNITTAFTAKTDENGIATFKTTSLYVFKPGEAYAILPLEAGKHAVELSVSADNIFAENVLSNLTITPAHIKIVMDNYEEYYGSDKNLTFTVTNVNGEVIANSVFKVEISGSAQGTYYVSTDENGTSQVSVSKLYKGIHEIKISNNDTKNICNETLAGNFTIKGLDAGFSVNASDVYVGENATVIVKINSGFAGFVAIDVGGENKSIEIIDGEGKFVFANLNAGNYTFNVTYGADLRYDDGMGTVSFKVSRQSPDFSIAIANVEEGTPITVEVTANANFTGDVIVKIGDNNVTVSVNDGKGTNATGIVLPVADNYKATLTFEGNDTFDAGNAETTFSVSAKPAVIRIDPSLTISVANITEGESAVIAITTNASFTGSVLVQIGQRNITVNVTAGIGSQSVADLPAATYTAVAIFKQTAEFIESIKNTTFTVNAKGSGDTNGTGDENTTPSGNDTNTTVKPKLVAKDLNAYYSLAKYSVTVYGTDGKVAKGVTVTFKINGKKIGTAKTNKKGIATIKLKQTPKTYTIVSEALGLKVSKTLKIKKVLVLKKISVKKSTKKLYLKATLKAGKKAIRGKKVTFKVNGKKVGTVKTNNKGLAKIKVKKKLLNKIKQSKKVKYQVTYLKVTVKKTAKIKK